MIRPVLEVFERLITVKSLQFSSTSRSATGWNVEAQGTVETEQDEHGRIIFFERGKIQTAQGKELGFSNVFRWSVETDILSLEHLRYGFDRPVFLFALRQIDSNLWDSIEAHQCSNDAYSGRLEIAEDELHMSWTIRGPQKNEDVSYRYR